MSYFIPQYLLPDPVAGQDVEENDEATAGRRRRRKRTKRGKHKLKARKKRKKAKAKKRTRSTPYQHPPPAPVVAPVHRFGASEFKANPTQVRGDRAGEYYLAADGYYGGKNNPIDVDKVKTEKKSSDNSKGSDNNKGGNRWAWQENKGDSGSRSGRTEVRSNRFQQRSNNSGSPSMAEIQAFFKTEQGQDQDQKAKSEYSKSTQGKSHEQLQAERVVLDGARRWKTRKNRKATTEKHRAKLEAQVYPAVPGN